MKVDDEELEDTEEAEDGGGGLRSDDETLARPKLWTLAEEDALDPLKLTALGMWLAVGWVWWWW